MIIAYTSEQSASYIIVFSSFIISLISLARHNSRKRLVGTLRLKHASKAQNATPLESKGIFEPLELKQLLECKAVVATSIGGPYYLDENSYAEMLRREKKIGLIAFAFLVLLAVALFALIYMEMLTTGSK